MSGVASWTTPRATDSKAGRNYTENMDGKSLAMDASLASWATPQAHDVRKRGSGNRKNRSGGAGCLASDAELASWPTPNAQDGPKGGPSQGVDRLPAAAALAG
ncbi:MAG TPA: hypothetical protein VNL96_06435, partial [Gemmatimonadaceae bacterium]|nr:hypothetical protein [Gemmatimonadaceae bacterium]